MTSLVVRALELPGGRGIHLFERNVMSHRRTWPIIVSGFFEPLFYLLSLGYGLGGYVGDVVIDGQTIEYAAFVAPGAARRVGLQRRLLRRDQHLLEAPVPEGLRRRAGDAARAEGHRVRRDGVRALPRADLRRRFLHRHRRARAARVVVALLAVPATVLIGFAFAGAGIAAVTYMRSWQDFDILNLANLPMFLFSATFFPLSTYPDWLEWMIRRRRSTTASSCSVRSRPARSAPAQLVNVAYLSVLGLVGMWIASRRVEKLLLT